MLRPQFVRWQLPNPPFHYLRGLTDTHFSQIHWIPVRWTSSRPDLCQIPESEWRRSYGRSRRDGRFDSRSDHVRSAVLLHNFTTHQTNLRPTKQKDCDCSQSHKGKRSEFNSFHNNHSFLSAGPNSWRMEIVATCVTTLSLRFRTLACFCSQNQVDTTEITEWNKGVQGRPLDISRDYHCQKRYL